MKDYYDDEFGEPTNDELQEIENNRRDGIDTLDIKCPHCKKTYNLLNAEYVASDPRCPKCGYIYGGEY